jgi:hypothetical protein
MEQKMTIKQAIVRLHNIKSYLSYFPKEGSDNCRALEIAIAALEKKIGQTKN